MSGAHCRIASATSTLPIWATVFWVDTLLHLRQFAALGHHRDAARGAFLGTHAAALAVVEVERDDLLVLDVHGRVGAVDPAEHAMRALRLVAHRALTTPAAGHVVARVAGLRDDRAARELLVLPLL